MKSILILNYLATFYTFTTAYNLSIYGGQSCRGQGYGTREMKADSGCQRDFAGNGASMSISKDEATDSRNIVAFFEGDDCNPLKIMQDGAATVYENGCWTGNYGSYEVWELR